MVSEVVGICLKHCVDHFDKLYFINFIKLFYGVWSPQTKHGKFVLWCQK